MELLPLLISFFQFCPNFSFLMTHPLLTSPRLGPFTEMAPAKLTNDFHVATSNGQFYFSLILLHLTLLTVLYLFSDICFLPVYL